MTMASETHTGPVGFTGFVHPTAAIRTDTFSIGGASLIESFVALEGQSAAIGVACNLQDNDRLLDFKNGGRSHRGDLELADGTFTAHGVTFIGKVRIGQACGTVINAVVQNAVVGDGCLVGPMARILGPDPERPVTIPDATLVLFGAHITSQDDVATNTMPVPAPFSLFAADVVEENLVLARGYNLLYRAAARLTPFSGEAESPRNPGADFPGVDEAFGKLSVAPPTVYRRGTGAIPARPATFGDLTFERFPPTAGGAVPAPDSPEAGARFIAPRVASPELVDDHAIVLGGCDLGSGVHVGAGSCVHGADAPAISVGSGTRIGRNTSLHELSLTSCLVGADCVIGDRVVLHGPLVVGDRVRVGNGSVLFGPTIADGVRIGEGALVFGPVEVKDDVPDGAVIVPPGMEFLIAPTASAPRGTLPVSALMLVPWLAAHQVGAGDCGLCSMLSLFT
jgi:carbonic anhydrase/acetyltransferase-like protein (isoleucine patch superfamily)